MAAKPQFFEIKDVSIIGKILDLANRHMVLITMWLKDQSVRFETNFVKYYPHLKKISTQFPITLNEIQIGDAFKKQGSQEIMGSFQLESVNFFFKTNVVRIVGNSLVQLDVPESLFKMQRRSNLRIPFPRYSAPKLTLFDPRKVLDPKKPILDTDLLAFRVLDVSVGGVAIAAKKNDAGLFPKGVIIHDLRFKLKGQDVASDAIVKHTFETTNDKNEVILKVGFEFRNIPNRFEKVIAQYVLEESRRLFSLFY